jgi:hypothetical protein
MAVLDSQQMVDLMDSMATGKNNIITYIPVATVGTVLSRTFDGNAAMFLHIL